MVQIAIQEPAKIHPLSWSIAFDHAPDMQTPSLTSLRRVQWISHGQKIHEVLP